MNRRAKLFLLVLVVIVATAWIVIKTSKTPVDKKELSAMYKNAISKANSLYKERISEGIDMSTGPCLTNDLLPGWVVDVVHIPRAQIDNLPENQCQAYLEGRAIHFVELDTNGNLVRVR